nr:hypothetical protein [Tanacetum cinerariifolium]
IPFPSCIHYGYNGHKYDDCVYYPICEIRGSYDLDTHSHNRIISLRRVIKPRNPQHVTKNCKTCGSNVHTTSDHNAIEWFKKREALQAKKNKSFKASKTESSSALRSKTPTKRKPFTKSPNMYKEYLAEFLYPAKALDNSKISFSTTTGGIYGEVGVNTFRNAVGAHYLSHSSEYVAPPSIDIVRPWFETIRYGEAFPSKRTRKNSLLPLRWRLLMAHIIQCLGGKIRGFDQITNKDAIILCSIANGINIDYTSIFWKDIIIKLNKKHREKVVPYTRFLSLLMLHKMKEGYGDGELTLYPTQVFSVNNWALKPDQSEEPPFTDHVLAICGANTPVVLKASKTSSKTKRVSQGIKPRAKPGHKKLSTSLKKPSVSSKEATKIRSYKAPTSSKTGHSKRRKESSSAMDSNPSEPPVSTPVDTGMHKADQQVIGGPTYLEVTSEARANPQLSSDMSAFNLNKPIFSASFIIHSECASENDASVVSTTEADLGKSAPSDFVPQQQGMNKGTKNTSYDHSFAVEEEEDSSIIKLEGLAKIMSNVKPSFKDLDSPEDDHVIVVDDSDEDEGDEVHTITEDTSVLKSSSPTSLPTKLKDLPSKFNKLTEEVKGLKQQVHELEIELPRDLKEIPSKLEDFTKTVISLTS